MYENICNEFHCCGKPTYYLIDSRDNGIMQWYCIKHINYRFIRSELPSTIIVSINDYQKN